MNEQKNVDLIKQAYDAFKRGDIPNLLGSMSPDIDWESLVGLGNTLPTTGRRRGLEQVARFFSALDQNLTFEQFEPREYIAQNDRVVVLGHYKGTVKTTNNPFEADWTMVFTVQNGKITTFQEYSNTANLVAAYGVPVNA